jgi:hypothetical protein
MSHNGPVYNALLDAEQDQLVDENLVDEESFDKENDGYVNVRSSRIQYTDGSMSGGVTLEKNDENFKTPTDGNQRDYLTRLGIYVFFVAALLLVAYISLAAIYHSYIYTQYHPEDYVYNYNPAFGALGAEPTGVIFATSKAAGLGTPANPIVVSLVGDSMINKAWWERNLGGKLLGRLAKITNLQFKFINRGSNGATISNIGRRIVPQVTADNSTIVILNWDSDATDSDTYHMTPPQYSQFKVNYEQELNWVMSNVTSLKQVKFMAIAGPSLYGEGPVFKPERFTPDKGQVLADLRDINIGVSQKFKVPYIDMNHALHSVSVNWWGLYRYWCTQDGEHYSELGASVEADNFVRFLTY